MPKGIREKRSAARSWEFRDDSCRYQRRRVCTAGMWYRSLAGWRNPPFPTLPRFAEIFLQGNRWLKSSRKARVRPVVIESVTKIMACGTTLMGYTQWCLSSRTVATPKRSASGVKAVLSALRSEGRHSGYSNRREPVPTARGSISCSRFPASTGPGVPQLVVTGR